MAISSSDPAKMGPVAAEKARLCILAARLRTRRMKFGDIAAELGLLNAQAARQAVSVGLGLMPAENFTETRREEAEGLDEKERELWPIVENPPPMTTVSGKLVLDPVTGGPIPDAQAKIAALRLLLDISKARRQLYGIDAPKQSVTFSGSLEDLRAEVERKQRELDAVERGDGDGPGGTVAALPQQGG